MIATILPKSSTFHAIAYNEKKVANGVAVLLEMKNISGPAALPGYTVDDMQKFFLDYSGRNSRIKFPQFHVAISGKGHEYTHEQLVAFAHKYLDEMGYADPGQPLLIYAHNDTDNTHIHIVTSRVAPDGHKIDHSHEQRRSLAVVDKLMNNDIKARVDADVAKTWEYTFKDVRGFQVIMQSFGYECYVKKDTGKVFIKYGGSIQKSLSISEVQTHIWEKDDNSLKDRRHASELNKRFYQLKGIFYKHSKSCGSREEFVDKLHRLFGLSIIFFGSKDNPSGYQIVDNTHKAVFPAPISIKNLQFRTYDDRLHASKELIAQILVDHPNSTTKDINNRLYLEHGTYIKEYTLHIDHKREELGETIITQLRNNNRAAMRGERDHSVSNASSDNGYQNAQLSKEVKETTLEMPDPVVRPILPPVSKIAKIGSGASSGSVNRDWEVGGGHDKDDLDEQMKQQMKL